MIAFLSSTSVQKNDIAFVFLSMLVIIDYVGGFGIMNLQIRCVGGKVVDSGGAPTAVCCSVELERLFRDLEDVVVEMMQSTEYMHKKI